MDILKQLLKIGSSPVYHGTNQADSIRRLGFQSSRNGTFGPGVYSTENEQTARSYGYSKALKIKQDPRLSSSVLKGKLPNRAPVLDAYKYFRMSPEKQAVARSKYIGLRINRAGKAGTEILIWNPRHANSIFGVGSKRLPIPLAGPSSPQKAAVSLLGQAAFNDAFNRPVADGTLDSARRRGLL
jgi:hypothetical protein